MTPRADNRKGRANGVTLASIVAEVERQLEWRGPNGGSQGHIVLDRPQAELLLQKLYDLQWHSNEEKGLDTKIGSRYLRGRV